ncbi:MAG: helix-turn-helix transcriptional regulator [Actinomycetota bacterium]|nr:helix-turn-helix transcriptional regulator [Actinomycetota bacterium]
MTARDRSSAVFVISVAAELAGVHPQTLRIYERKGLLAPARTDGGNRRYSEADIDRLQRINDLTDGGLNLAGVKWVLELERELASVRAELAEVRSLLDQTTKRYRRDLVPWSQATRPFRP